MTLARVRAVAPAPAPAPAREAERQPGRGQAEVECVGVGRAGGLGLCMPSLDVVRFATPFLPANWQLSTLRGACPVTGAHVHTTRLDDRSKFNANTEFQLSRCCVPLPSVRVCARRTCLIAQFMGGRLHVIKCKLQTDIGPIQPPTSNYGLLSVICVRYLTCISNLAAALRGSPLHPIMNSIGYVCVGAKLSRNRLRGRESSSK